MDIDRKTVRRPNVGDLVVTRFGDAKVLEVKDQGLGLKVQTLVHGVELVGRAAEGHWTVRVPIAWGAWNQGFFPSVRKAMRFADGWLNHPDNTGHNRLWLIRHDTRPGWRLINCGSRQPMVAEMERGFYGPITSENIAAKRKEHGA